MSDRSRRSAVQTRGRADSGPATLAGAIESLLPIQIRTDGHTQARVRVEPERIATYAEEMARGDRFPPILVFYDGEHYWMADGFHRLPAHVEAFGPQQPVAVELRTGTVVDARRYACGANAAHGYRRTREDVWHAILLVLTDPALLYDAEDRLLSYREIAALCKTTHPTVSALVERAQTVVATLKRDGHRHALRTQPDWLVHILQQHLANRQLTELLDVPPAPPVVETPPKPSSQPVAQTVASAKPPPLRTLSEAETVALLEEALDAAGIAARPYDRLQWLNLRREIQHFTGLTPPDARLDPTTFRQVHTALVSKLDRQWQAGRRAGVNSTPVDADEPPAVTPPPDLDPRQLYPLTRRIRRAQLELCGDVGDGLADPVALYAQITGASDWQQLCTLLTAIGNTLESLSELAETAAE